MIFKRITALFFSFFFLFAFCSCGSLKYMDMKQYLNSNTEIEVNAVSDWVYNEANKSVLLCIELPRGSEPTLEDLEGLRIALNEYMQREGGFLEQGWQVSIYIDEQMNGSSIGERYAVLANFEQGTMGFEGNKKHDTANYLNTFWFKIDPNDIEYISELSDVENLFLAGKYSESDEALMNEAIEEISSLGTLKTLRVFPNWYEGFVNADLDCEIIETIDDSNGNGDL